MSCILPVRCGAVSSLERLVGYYIHTAFAGTKSINDFLVACLPFSLLILFMLPAG
jgi:hypothetical protein